MHNDADDNESIYRYLLWMTSGFEVSGVVDELSPNVDVTKVKVGDHVIVYPTDEEESTESGYLRLVITAKHCISSVKLSYHYCYRYTW